MEGLEPTARQIDILLANCKTGSIKQAAFYLGVGVQTVRSQLSSLYAVLDVHSAIEATVKLGWTALPPDPPRCDYRSHCPYLKGHTGTHGVLSEVDSLAIRRMA